VGPSTTERMDEILDLLRTDGGRITPARRAVVQILVDTDDHISADDIAGRVQRDMPDVAPSTVYRTLDVLHLSERVHVHLMCRGCNRVIELPDTYLDDLATRLAEDHGFALEPRHFALLGRCRDCGG